MRLGRRERDVALAPAPRAAATSATGGSGAQAPPALRQARQQRASPCASACARVTAPTMLTLARQGCDAALRSSVAHVGDVDARQRGLGGLVAVGVAAVDRLREGAAGDASPAGCWPRGCAAPMRCALALPDVVRERRLADLRAASATALASSVGIGQRAQREAHAVAAGAGAEAGAQVGPGLAQLRSRPAPARRRCAAHALVDHAGGDAGQAGLARPGRAGRRRRSRPARRPSAWPWLSTR